MLREGLLAVGSGAGESTHGAALVMLRLVVVVPIHTSSICSARVHIGVCIENHGIIIEYTLAVELI